MVAQSGQLLPRLAAVGRAEQGGVFHPGVDRVGVGQRRFEMPDSCELPGMGRAVVPQVSAGDAVVHELVAHRLPGLAAVVGALDQLPEPAGALRRVQPIRVGGRSLEVVDLPAPKVGTTDVPAFALSVRLEDECALACANQYPYPAHPSLLPEVRAGPSQAASSRLARSARSSRSLHPPTRAAGGPLYRRTAGSEIDIPAEKTRVPCRGEDAGRPVQERVRRPRGARPLPTMRSPEAR